MYFSGLPGDPWTSDPSRCEQPFRSWRRHRERPLVIVLGSLAHRCERRILGYCDAEDHRDHRKLQGPGLRPDQSDALRLRDAAEIRIFDPVREGADGIYANLPGCGLPGRRPLCRPRLASRAVPGKICPAGPMARSCSNDSLTFNTDTRMLDLHYLLSFGRPYH